MAYVLHKQIAGEGPDEQSLELLLRGQHSVNITRDALPQRGNVRPEAERDNYQTKRYISAARTYSSEKMAQWNGGTIFRADGMPLTAGLDLAVRQTANLAAANFMQVGNCGEHATACALIASKLLGEGEQSSVVAASREDHAWAELGSAGKRVVMDAWAEGPAVLASDSKFSSDPSQTLQGFALNRATGSRLSSAFREMQQPLLDLRANFNNYEIAKKLVELVHAPEFTDEVLREKMLDPTSVLSKKFVASATERWRLDPEPANKRRRLNAHPRTTHCATATRHERAAHAARTLGATAEEAAKQAPAIVAAAARLLALEPEAVDAD